MPTETVTVRDLRRGCTVTLQQRLGQRRGGLSQGAEQLVESIPVILNSSFRGQANFLQFRALKALPLKCSRIAKRVLSDARVKERRTKNHSAACR